MLFLTEQIIIIIIIIITIIIKVGEYRAIICPKLFGPQGNRIMERPLYL